jgi:Effector-associated domain 11
MANSIDINSIKALIGAAKLDDAIKLLIQKGKEEKNSVLERFGLSLSGQLNDLSKKIIQNTISYDEMNLRRDKIQSRVMDVISHYENGTLYELENTEEYRQLPTPKEIGKEIADAKYYETIQTYKRFWWIYIPFILFMLYLLFGQDLFRQRQTTITTPQVRILGGEDKTKNVPVVNCRIKSGPHGMELKEKPVYLSSSPPAGARL